MLNFNLLNRLNGHQRAAASNDEGVVYRMVSRYFYHKQVISAIYFNSITKPHLCNCKSFTGRCVPRDPALPLGTSSFDYDDLHTGWSKLLLVT